MFSNVSAQTLVTDSFKIMIEYDCNEGEVTCDKIHFLINAAGSDEKKSYIGNTLHSICADGITPCTFLGYEFEAHGLKYIIYTSGTLEVINYQGKQTLLETGKWVY